MIAEATALNTVDFIALGIIGFSIFVGVIRGFTHDFIGTAALIIALIATVYGEPYYGPFLEETLGSTPLVALGSGLTIFLVVSAALSFIGNRLGDAIKGTAIGSLDRALGLAFGLARGAFVVSFLYFIVGVITPNLPENMITARFAPWYLEGAHFISESIPEGTFGLKSNIPIANFKPTEVYKTIESLDDAVEDMSTLKPKTPEKKNAPKTVW